VRELARSVAEAYYASRERLGFPMASRGILATENTEGTERADRG